MRPPPRSPWSRKLSHSLFSSASRELRDRNVENGIRAKIEAPHQGPRGVLHQRLYQPLSRLRRDDVAGQIKTHFIGSASDLEMCDFGGKTYINYGIGDQQGFYYMCEAWYDGPMGELLENFFK